MIAGLLCLIASAARAQTATAVYTGTVVALGGGYGPPSGVAVDGYGDVYVADWNNKAVREIPYSCINGANNSSCTLTLGGGFTGPADVAVDGSGNVYVADQEGSAVKEIPYSCITGANDSSCTLTLGGGFNNPFGVAVDVSGSFVYVADSFNGAVKRIPKGCASSTCVTVLGAGGIVDPGGVAVDGSGNVWVTDTGSSGNFPVKEIPASCIAGANNSSCVLTFNFAFGDLYKLALDGAGNVYVADEGLNQVREIPASCFAAPNDNCSIELGGGAFSQPRGVAVDGNGTVYVGATGNGSVDEITKRSVNFGNVAVNTTTPATQTLYFGFTNSTPAQIGARMALTMGACASTDTCANPTTNPLDFAVVTDWTPCNLHSKYASGVAGYVGYCSVQVAFTPQSAGTRTGAVELTDTSGTVIAKAIVYGTGVAPQVVFSPSTVAPLGSGGFAFPNGVAVDGGGNVYVADQASSTLKEIPASCIAGANDKTCMKSLGGGFSSPSGVALDGSGNLYVGDTKNNAVKEMPPGCASSSCVTVLGGGFSSPYGVAVDSDGNLFVADRGNQALKEIPPGCASASCVSTIGAGFAGPMGVALDSAGYIYVADYDGNAVKATYAGCQSFGCVTLIAVSLGPTAVAVDSGFSVYFADMGDKDVNVILSNCSSSVCAPTLRGGFAAPTGLALDSSGNVYVTDWGNSAVDEIARATPPSLNFSVSAVGVQSSNSPLAVTLQNIGNAGLTFPIPNLSINPTILAGGFAFDNATTCPVLGPSSGSPGALAAGATCDYAIDFIPTAVGVSSGPMLISDQNLNASPSVTQTVNLSGTGVQILPSSLTSATIGVPYSVAFSVNGAADSFSFSLFSGALPPGLHLSALGVLSGTPTSAGPFNFTLQVTDLHSSATVNEAYALKVNFSQILPSSLSPATAGLPYRVTFSVSGAANSFSFSLFSGALPPGLHLSELGVLSGTPTSAGPFKFTVQVTDLHSGATVNEGYALNVNSPASLTSPARGSVLAGPIVTFHWTKASGATSYSFRLGTTVGASNIFASGVTTATSVTATTLPTNGKPLYGRLYTNYGAIQVYSDYFFTASTPPTCPPTARPSTAVCVQTTAPSTSIPNTSSPPRRN
jgi:DNA-binding beta-propeller fold protein YncE